MTQQALEVPSRVCYGCTEHGKRMDEEHVYADNIFVAIMVKVNELATRHGMSPVDASAVLEADGDNRALRFVPPVNEVAEKRFARMQSDLGIVDPEVFTIRGTDQEILSTLDRALERAPKSRRR